MVKALVTFEGVGQILKPGLDVAVVSREHANQIFLDQFKPVALGRQLMRGVPESSRRSPSCRVGDHRGGAAHRAGDPPAAGESVRRPARHHFRRLLPGRRCGSGRRARTVAGLGSPFSSWASPPPLAGKELSMRKKPRKRAPALRAVRPRLQQAVMKTTLSSRSSAITSAGP